ncbi:MAG: hypothetical protein KKD01_06120 [Proteobacteria bacterium]|nr:hypothetical protein [Pseudomonadota bacterium]MBU1419354.1 hypothetical protein [Pseudomonadota bacterium]MBU1454288.1 hypothetical protein [Pseudomonadota bacterium]
MAKYKPYSCAQGQFIPDMFASQILPNTVESTLSQLVDNRIDPLIFCTCFRNDETGTPALAPHLLLNIIILPITEATPVAKLPDVAMVKIMRRKMFLLWRCQPTVAFI